MGVEVVTFGCRLNTVESEAMRRSALETGHDGLVIFNTCAVTAEATRQARQSIRRLKRERPKARIVVTGCAAQVEPERFAEMAEVDNVLGNTEKAAPESWAALNDPASMLPAYRSPTSCLPARSVHPCSTVSKNIPGPSCKCRTAAIIAARSASFRSDEAIPGRCR